MNSQVFFDDIALFKSTFPLAGTLENSCILVTGATGLIGRCIVEFLLASVERIKIIAPVRNVRKAREMFSAREELDIIEGDLVDFLAADGLIFDYAIHCASPTNGSFIASHPAETFTMMYDTTRNLLEAARRCHARGVVYISSIEYYGVIEQARRPIKETEQGFINHDSLRSAYPLGKQACEFLCKSYSAEYGLRVMIARPTQIFGAGTAETENRVFAQFAKSIVDCSDIVLHTKGNSSKPYCYTTDAVSALLYILLLGQPGEAYNIANENTYMSVRQLAEYLVKSFCPDISIKIDLHPELAYAPDTFVPLSTSKLQELGWRPLVGVHEMFRRYISYIK